MARSGSFAAPAGYRDSPSRALNSGEVVASTYAIKDELLRTEDGVVFEAKDMVLDRIVAFKLAWRDPGTPSLMAEARRCAAVRDACAVQVHGMGMHNGAEYVVGERVVGHLLRDELRDPLPAEVYFGRLRTLVGAVARAHEAGIAVGDISGSTVLAAEGGRMVLGRLSLSQVPAFATHGHILAPEVVRGDVDAADPAAAEAIDLYGLGCVAIELACGAAPFADDDEEAMLRGHAVEPPPRLADLRAELPGELSDLVESLLAKQPTDRPRNVRDVATQLDAIAERTASGSRPVRVLIVDDDAHRARVMWSIARRAHAGAIVEIAGEGTDAAHKLVRDMPEVVLVDAALRGVMNALELCMYARGLRNAADSRIYLVGSVSESDRGLFEQANVDVIPDDPSLADAILDVVRSAASLKPRPRRPSLVSG